MRAPGLAVVRTVGNGKPRYIVSDLASGRHLALSAAAYALLGKLDGRRFEEAAAAIPGLSRGEAEAVVRRLAAAGLVRTGDAPPPPATPQGPVEGRYLFVRRELVELAPLLPALDRWFGWLFRPAGVALWTALGVVALWRVAAADHVDDPFAWASQLGAVEAAALFMVFFALKLAHELGHALALRRMAAAEGLPLHSVRAGIAVMLFAPFPFTNVTAAWGLASKWRRAAVGVAGMYVESWIAVIALLIWSATDSPLLQTACLQVATVAGVTTLLFNLNPFGRMDGYYVFSDLIDRPNLMQRGHGAAMAAAARLFRARPPEELPPLDLPMLGYWAGTVAYRVLVFAGMVWLAHRLGGWAALLMLAIAGSLLLLRPAAATARWLLAEAADRHAVRRRLLVFGGSVAALLALVPFPAGIAADGIADSTGALFVFPPGDVRIAAVAPPGARGDRVLLQLDSADLAAKRIELTTRQAQMLERWRGANDRGEADAQVAAEAAAGLGRSLTALDGEAARLTVAPRRGWDPLDAEAYLGSWVAPDRSRPLAVAIEPGRLRVHAVVPQSDADALRHGGGTAQARVAGRPDLRFAARIMRIDGQALDQLPSAALGRPGGGSVAVDPHDAAGRRTVEPMVGVWLAPEGRSPPLRYGQRIEVRFGLPPRPLLWQAAAAATRLLDDRATRPGS